MQALMTGLARISGIDLNNRNTLSHSLVLKEMTELVERPTIRATALSPISRLLVRAVSDSGQVLNGYDRIERFGFVDDFGTDAMVEPSLIASLPPCRFNTLRQERLVLRVPCEAFCWSDALTLAKWSRIA
jgi:hypothetical protein